MQWKYTSSNYFVRRLHYAAGEVRSYTLYFPMHHRMGIITHRQALLRKRMEKSRAQFTSIYPQLAGPDVA